MSKSLRELEKKKEQDGLNRREAARLRGLKGSKRKRELERERQDRSERARRGREMKKEAQKQANFKRKVTRTSNEFDIPREEAREEVRTEQKNKTLQENIETNPEKEYLQHIPQQTTIFG